MPAGVTQYTYYIKPEARWLYQLAVAHDTIMSQ